MRLHEPRHQLPAMKCNMAMQFLQFPCGVLKGEGRGEGGGGHMLHTQLMSTRLLNLISGTRCSWV